MKVGTVTGKIWTTRRLEELPGGALLEIEVVENNGSIESLLAYDPLGAGQGERVLVTQGSVAKGWFKSGNAVVDALVIGIVDEETEEGTTGMSPYMAEARRLAGQLPVDVEIYNIKHLAEVLDLTPKGLRDKLRDRGMRTGSGRPYAWTRKEAEKVIEQALRPVQDFE